MYTDGRGNDHGYTYDIGSRRYGEVTVAGDSNLTAAGINNLGDIAGLATNGAGTTEGFLKRSDGKVVHLDVPGASSTRRSTSMTATTWSATHRRHRLERDHDWVRVEPRLRVREHQ
jgi:hypothetical protein